MHFKIADFIIEVEKIKEVDFPLNLFLIKDTPNHSEIKIIPTEDYSLNVYKMQLIFSADGFWKIFKENDKLIFYDSFTQETNLKQRFIILNRDLSQGLFVEKPDFSGKNPLLYPLGPLMLLYKLFQEDGVFLHASGVKDKKGRGYIFCGPSGSGKTTLAKLWMKNKQGVVLNEDRLIIRRIKDKFYAYGCPWYIRNKDLVSPEQIELKKVFFLRHSQKNYMRLLDKRETFLYMLKQAHFLIWEKRIMEKIFDFLEILCENIYGYELGFKPTKKIIEFLED